MLNIKRHHIRLLVDNFRECFIFYRDIIDLPVRYGTEDADYAEFKTDAIHIALYKKSLMRATTGITPNPTNEPMDNPVAIVLRVDDVDQIFEFLNSKGVTFDTVPEDRKEWDCRTAHFRDPDGNLLELNADLH